jgi:hypothetical protein
MDFKSKGLSIPFYFCGALKKETTESPFADKGLWNIDTRRWERVSGMFIFR